MESGYPRRRILSEWAAFAQSLFSMSKARFFLSNCQANDITPPPEQVHHYVSPGGWHPSVPWLSGACSHYLEFVDDFEVREERTPCYMTWPGQYLWICASQLHQVCTEALPHPREGVWHLDAVLQECLHAFHHYQPYDGLACIGSRHHDGLRCLTSAVCHVYGANPTRHCRHCQRLKTKQKQKWRCPTPIAGIHGRCNHTRPVQIGHTGATGRFPRPLHMDTDEGQAKEESLWGLDRLYAFPSLTDTEESRYRGMPSLHWETWASRKTQGMVLPAWSLTSPPVASADLRDFPLPGWNYPTGHQQFKYLCKWLGVPAASEQLASILQ